MRSFRKCLGKLGNIFKDFLYYERSADTCTITIVDENDVALSDVAIQIKSINGAGYMQTVTTDSNGEATLNGTIGVMYELTLAKSGVNQLTIRPWTFQSTLTVEYQQIPKTIWDGMHADTSPQMYVDTHDGENA